MKAAKDNTDRKSNSRNASMAKKKTSVADDSSLKVLGPLARQRQ